MVEFALIGPLFFLLVVLIIQGALYINAQGTIDNTTREMARVASVCGTTPGEWRYRNNGPYSSCQAAMLAQKQLNFLPNQGSFVVTVCSGSNIPSSGACTTGYDQPTSTGEAVQVNVTYTYTFYVDPLLGSAGPSLPISSSARVVTQQ